MSMSVGSYSSLSSKKGLAGLVSGLDTNEIIEQMTSGTRQKITSQLQKQQIAIWKRDAYRGVSKQLTDFNNKYFSYTNSKNNILRSNFFDASSVNCSSDYVKVSGNSANAKKVVIENISQLATTSSFSSTHKVSNEKIQSGTIYESWKDNTVAGTSMTISYGGKNHTISINSDFYIDSTKGDANIDSVVAELNKSIKSNSDLKGKLEFAVTVDNKIELKQIGSLENQTNDLRIERGNINLLTSLGLYTSPKAEGTGTPPVYDKIVGTDPINSDAFFEKNNVAGSTIGLNVNGKTVSLTLSSDFRFTGVALEKDTSGNFTTSAKTAQVEQLQAAFNESIKNNDILNGTDINSTTDDLLKIEIQNSAEGFKVNLAAQNAENGGTASIKIMGGTETLLTALGLKADNISNPASESITGEPIVFENVLSQFDNSLEKALSGTTITVNLNGITKKIEFRESDKAKFSTIDGTNGMGLKSYLQQELDKAYGSGNVVVSLTNDGSNQFIFNTKDSGSVFSFQSSSTNGLLGQNSALHINMGESNRVEFSKPLQELQSEFITNLNPAPGENTEYKIDVNGKEFTFNSDTTLNDVLSKINGDPDAGITISYSSVTNTFNAVSKEMGSKNTISIKDISGNLSEVLLGKADDPLTSADDATASYKVKDGTDFKANMSFDGGNAFTEVTRSENTFTIDGVSFEFSGKAENSTDALGNIIDTKENISFTVTNNVDDIVKKISDFITDYNDIISSINDKLTEKKYGRQSAEDTEVYLPLTDEQKKEMSEAEVTEWEKKAKMGLLRNDSALSSITYNLRRAITDVVKDSEDALYQIGISTKAYSWDDGGKLEIDEEKLKSVLSEDPNKVIRIFTTTDTGISYRLQNVLKDSVMGNEKGEGLLIQIAGKENGISLDQSSLSQSIYRMNEQLSTLKTRLISEEDRYWAKFTQLEKYMSMMNQQSSWLTQQNQ